MHDFNLFKYLGRRWTWCVNATLVSATWRVPFVSSCLTHTGSYTHSHPWKKKW